MSSQSENQKDNPFDIYETHQDLSAVTQEIRTDRGRKNFTLVMVILVVLLVCLLLSTGIYAAFILPERREARQQQLIQINASNTLTSAAATLAEEIRQEQARQTAFPNTPDWLDLQTTPTPGVQP